MHGHSRHQSICLGKLREEALIADFGFSESSGKGNTKTLSRTF